MSEYKTFQIVDIIADDLPDDTNNKSFIITLYGIDKDNNRVVCHITKYLPYFYIKIPNDWDQPTGVKLIKDICNIKPRQDIENTIFGSVKGIVLNTCKDFYGVYWNQNTDNIQSFNYLKISMKTYDSMTKIIKLVKTHYNLKKYNSSSKLGIRLNEWKLNTISNYDCDCNLYESTIHPIIRFIHDTNINPTGWVQCKCKNDIITGLFNSCEYEYSASFKSLKPYDHNEISKYKIASFDIECDSSHGDFPLAKKNFKKLAVDIFDSYQSILKNSPESRRELYNNKIEIHLLKLLISGFTGDFSKFNSSYKYANMSKINIINNEIPDESVYDDIIDKIMEDIYLIENIKDLEIKGKDRDNCINKIQGIIDERCNVLNIQVEGDPIIQIGTVFYEFGSGDITRHILVISPNESEEICDNIDGIIVERCKDEKELLLGWKNIINKMDPDFITGYNIFGFDFKYIYDRAKVLFTCKDKCNDPWWHVSNCPMKEFLNFGKMNSKIFKSKDHKNKKCNMKTQKLSSSALGDNTLNYLTMDGRILFDIQKEVQKGHNLESYKLDNVAAHFMRGKLLEKTDNKISVSDIGQLKNGDYISFRTHTNIGEELFNDGKKYQILKIIQKDIYLTENIDIDLKDYHKVEWCLNKDDISPQDIFDKHKYGGPSGRAEVAKYCIQDCELCINLLLLLDIVPNNLGMANVSYVPASFIFLRGQGVKVSSVISRESGKRNTRIPDLKKLPNLKDYIKMYNNKKTISDNDLELRLNKLEEKNEDEGKINSKQKDLYLEHFKKIECPIEKNTKLEIIENSGWRKPEEYELDDYYKRIISQSENGIDGYEGAIVLDPTPGIYLEDPISVLDYASLYPSSIIEKNISHETYIENKDLLPIIGEQNYYTISYQDWIYKGKGTGDTIEKVNAGTETVCHFLKPEYMKEKNMFQEGEKHMGIIPAVLNDLLSARKNTKKLMKNETDDFKKKVLDGLQLAYKVTANSVYGQLGAKTSGVFKMNLAACTTSVGRSRIYDASRGVKEWANKKGYKEPEVVYGDTDSVFVKFSRELLDGTILEGKEALDHCIQCGKEAGDYITHGIIKGEDEDGEEIIVKHDPLLKHPQDLEYEKTFWPFILISKKRYTGDKYEFDSKYCSRNAMGIVLKRRDNAPIVKYIFGNVIEKIMIEKDFELAVNWLKENLLKIRNGEFSLRYFIITKALNGYYKNPQQIAHKVLADRMAVRDPGNKPKPNDRIPYAYIKLNDDKLYDYNNPYKSGARKGQPRLKNVMQGDRIEHYDYIVKHNLTIDYEFYITNQIMNPVKQVLDLHMDEKETEQLFYI